MVTGNGQASLSGCAKDEGTLPSTWDVTYTCAIEPSKEREQVLDNRQGHRTHTEGDFNIWIVNEEKVLEVEGFPVSANIMQTWKGYLITPTFQPERINIRCDSNHVIVGKFQSRTACLPSTGFKFVSQNPPILKLWASWFMFVTLAPWRRGAGELPSSLAELVSFSPARDATFHKTKSSRRTTLKVVL